MKTTIANTDALLLGRLFHTNAEAAEEACGMVTKCMDSLGLENGQRDAFEAVVAHVAEHGDWIPAPPKWDGLTMAWEVEDSAGCWVFRTDTALVRRHNRLRAALMDAHAGLGLQLELF